MATALFTHQDCLQHDTGSHHPERIERLRAVLAKLETEEFTFLDRREAPLGERRVIEKLHRPSYVDQVLDTVPAEGYASLDGDTVLSPNSGNAALRGVGAVCAAVDAVMAGEIRNAFCATRPPGHHAEADKAMGFCLFNNAALGAMYAWDTYEEIERVAVIDFDVHHGNGTQAMFENHKFLFYASTHQSPGYPETGHENDTGIAENIVNVPLPPGTKGPEFCEAYDEVVLPKLRAFEPDFIIISAGFDAHARDPLAYFRVQTPDFVWLTRELLAVAKQYSKNRVVSVLEGGYDIEALSDSAAAHVRVLMSE